MFSRSFTYGALSASQNTIPISSAALSRDVSYEGKPECTALAPSKYSKSDTLRTKIVAAVGWYLVRSFGLFCFLCGLRPTLLRPHFLWRRFPQFTSGGLYHKIWRRKKNRSRRREKEITLRITSYYCKQQSRALKGQGASHHSHVFVTGAHDHAHKELSLTCTHLR